MASRISQMRNEMLPQQPQQQQLSESIERTKMLMEQFKNMPNPQQAVTNYIQNNSQLNQLAALLNNPNKLEGLAKQIAYSKNLDINDVIRQLGGST